MIDDQASVGASHIDQACSANTMAHHCVRNKNINPVKDYSCKNVFS